MECGVQWVEAWSVQVVVTSLCWWCCCAADFVVPVISLYWWFCCADDLLRWWGSLCVRCAGDFVALVIFCAGAFVALVISLCVFFLRWWCCCAGGDFVVLVVMLLCWLVVSFWTVAQVPSLRRYERTMHAKKVRFPIAEVCARSPRTWIHSGSWLPSCFEEWVNGKAQNHGFPTKTDKKP